MVQVNKEFGDLLSSSLRNYSNELTDNVFEGFVLTKYLNDEARITAEGGVSVVEQVVVGKNETVAWRGDTDVATKATTLNTEQHDPTQTGGATNQGQTTSLEFDWKQVTGVLSYNAMEVTKNRGRAALYKMIEQRLTTVEETFKDVVERTLLGGRHNGTNFFADSKSPDGLRSILTKLTPQATAGTDDPGELHDYHGVPYNATASEIAWIQPRVDYLGANTDVSVDAIEKMITKLDRGGTDSSDIIISSSDQWRAISKEIRGQQQWHNTTMADAGFRNFMVERVPMFYVSEGYVAASPDNNQPWDEDWVAVLNSKYIKLVKHSTDWMENYGFQQVNRSAVWEALIRSVMLFLCTGRRYQGLIVANQTG